MGSLPTVCFANKSDLIDEATYDWTKANELAKELNFLKVYSTSAKTGKQVQDAFGFIIDYLVKDALKPSQ